MLVGDHPHADLRSGCGFTCPLRGAVAMVLSLVVIASSQLFGAVPSIASATDECQSLAAEEQETPVQINLVIDDSGSMIFDSSKASAGLEERWSFADYSMQVFVALMREPDLMKIYRLSDFDTEDSTQPDKARVYLRESVATIKGSEATQDRVDKVKDIDFQGGKTAYGAVDAAFQDLKTSKAEGRWLVILTDGEFIDGSKKKIKASQVEADLKRYAEKGSEGQPAINVVFLSLGDDANIESDPTNNFFTAHAATSEQLLGKLNSFSNQIFGRQVGDLGRDGTWEADIPMSRVDIFAQGQGVEVGPAQEGSVQIRPVVASVRASDNREVVFKRVGRITPKVKTSLQGVVASFPEIPAGEVTFDVTNSEDTSLFYTPNVFFGLRLTNDKGETFTLEPNGEVSSGKYQVDYGFMTADCEFVSNSPLLKVSEMNATLSYPGKDPEEIKDKGTIELTQGNATLNAQAVFLGGSPVNKSVPLVVIAAATSRVEARDLAGSFNASELTEFPPPSEGLRVQFVIVEETGDRIPTEEEWKTLDEEDLTYSTDASMEFEIIKDSEPGQITLLPRAPGGDIYEATTGTVEVEVGATKGIQGADTVTPGVVSFEVVQDYSSWDKFKDWFQKSGWKWLLFLLLLILIAGYVFKKRFSKKMKRRPSIAGTPSQVGTVPVQDTGKFKVNGGRKFLPFVADTATMSYVPSGTSGFRSFKLKAGPRKSMTVMNYKLIAEKENVEINGNPLDKDTKRPPILSTTSTITATTPTMSYECTPNA